MSIRHDWTVSRRRPPSSERFREHNLDTSHEFYGQIVTTRTYDDRLNTLARFARADITACRRGIIEMGEDRPVRYPLLQQLAARDGRLKSVPVNLLVTDSASSARWTRLTSEASGAGGRGGN